MSKANNPTNDLRTPDTFHQLMTVGLNWLGERIGWLLGAGLVLVLALAVYGVWGYVRETREMEWQEKYFSIEKRLTDKQRGFDEAAQSAQIAAANPKAPAAKGPQRTGDLTKDYGTLPQELRSFVESAGHTRAGEMAALNAADLQLRYKNVDEAQNLLSLVNKNDRVSDLLGSLVVNMKATVAADKGDCPRAVGLWEKIAGNSKTKFLHDEAKLRMGLCLETMGNSAKAVSLYEEVAQQNPKEGGESKVAQDAQRYLRAAKTKSGAGAAPAAGRTE